MITFLVLETLMIGIFTPLDLVFYIFFSRPPCHVPDHRCMGRPRRVYVSFKFFLYTLLGSVLMLIAVIAMFTVRHPVS